MHGEPSLNPGFDSYHADINQRKRDQKPHLGYDSMNPFIVKGRSAYGIRNYMLKVCYLGIILNLFFIWSNCRENNMSRRS